MPRVSKFIQFPYTLEDGIHIHKVDGHLNDYEINIDITNRKFWCYVFLPVPFNYSLFLYRVLKEILATFSLQWRHKERDGVSNHQLHECLFNHLFKAQIKENIKAPRHWPLWGEFTGDRWIPRTKDQ